MQHGMQAQRAGGSAGEESEEGAAPRRAGLAGRLPRRGPVGHFDDSALAPYLPLPVTPAGRAVASPRSADPTWRQWPWSCRGSPSASAGDFRPKFAPPLLPDFLYPMMEGDRAQGSRLRGRTPCSPPPPLAQPSRRREGVQ